MTDTPQPAEKPKLRWYQYRLSHLFILMTLVAIGCGWFSCKLAAANKQKEAVRAIEEMGGVVGYNYEYDATDDFIPNADPPGPAWFRNLVGVDFLADVVVVDLTFVQVTDAGLEHLKELTKLKDLWLEGTDVSDAGLEHLRGLTNLEVLDLGQTDVNDTDLVHLKGLTKLKYLALDNTQVTDAGLEHLQGLTNLEVLGRGLTQVTNKGLRKLQHALPNCKIHPVLPRTQRP